MKIDLNELSEEQKQNFMQAVDSFESKSETSSIRPPVLYIELTQNCISRCDFCKPNWKNDPSFNMKDELFEILLQDYVRYATLVDLRGWGESLMLSDFSKKLARVKELGPKVRIATTLGCGSKQTLQSLVDNDVYVSVSFDAVDKGLYESIRKGIKYNVVMKNLDYISSRLMEKGTIGDNLRLSATLHRDNINQAEGILELASEYHISQVRIVPVQSFPTNPILLKYYQQETSEVLDKLAHRAKKKGINLQLGFAPFEEFYVKSKVFDPCCHPWMYALINYDGNIRPCEHMLGNSDMNLSVGNIRNTGPEWWNNQDMRKLRRAHSILDLEAIPKKCHKCYSLGRYSDHEQDLYEPFKRWEFTEDDILSITRNKNKK